MREIKFRAFINGKMTTDDFVLIDKKWCIDEKKLGCPINIGILNMEENEIPVMQYTGLKDKNGKEIYEGDIVAYGWQKSEIGEVIWKDYCFKVERPGTSDMYFNHPESFEVVGNIYESPTAI